MKRILIILLACLMIIPAFVGCNTSGNQGSSDTTDSGSNSSDAGNGENNGDTALTELSLIENGATSYKIIRSQNAKDYVISAMTDFRNAVKEKYGVTFSPSDDWVQGIKGDQTYESADPEILIGETNRKESQEVLATLKRGEYKVCVVGNKLVMIGYNDYLTSLAVKDFMEKELAAADSEKLSVDASFNYTAKNQVETLGDSDATLRIMTFNVLGKSEEYMARIHVILKTIETHSPDIIGFQECNKEQHQNMISILKTKKYDVAYTMHKNSSTYVYTPILYRIDKYTLVEAGSEWLDSRYTKTNTKSIGWAVLEDNVTGEKFGVINIHGSLWSNDYDLPDGKTHADMNDLAANVWKEDNIRQMNDRMQAIIKKHGDIGILWTGDFNFNKNHAAYNKATEEYGMHDAEFTATDKRDPGLKTTHPVGKKNDPESGNSIDHIFGNDKITFRLHQVCNEGDEIKGSDHYAVFADVKFN